MLRRPIRKYGRTVVVADSQLAFDNILEQTDLHTKESPFCSSDSSHTSSHNCSLSLPLDHSSFKPVTRQASRNVKGSQTQSSLKPDGSCSKEGKHGSLLYRSGNRCNLLFHEESDSLLMCTPVKKKKQRNILTENNKQIKATNKQKQKNVTSKQARDENYYSLSENVPDFDDIAQDDLIVSSTPGQPERCPSGRFGHNASIFSQPSPNVSFIGVCNNNQFASSPLSGQNCVNITFRRFRQTPKATGKLKKSKTKQSPDSGNLSDDTAAGDLCELTDSEPCTNISGDSASFRLSDDVDNLTTSLHIMRLRSFNKTERFASSSHNSLYSDMSLQGEGECIDVSETTGSPILFEDSHDQHSLPMPLIVEEDSCYSDNEEEVDEQEEDDDEKEYTESMDEADEEEASLENLSKTTDVTGTDLVCSSMSFSEKLSNSSLCKNVSVTAKERVLSLCCQTEPISFSESIPSRMMSKCVKIGEGVYGEVFRSFSHGQAVALKIIPIEGNQEVNDCPQKKFDEILPEIVIAKELSDLACSDSSQASNFCQVQRVSCVQGVFPPKLLEQWDLYSQNKVSENDRPDMFPADQLFIVFEFVDGGCPLENYKFLNHNEAFSVLRQVVFALAVAESELEFEHRDLHIGNVLVRSCIQETVLFKLQDREYQVPTEGVIATIIDFTISRLKKDGCAVFFDISTDDGLFEGEGDFQFDVYRDMRTENGNDWQKFCPHSNVLWVNYICKKFNVATKFQETGRSCRDIQRHLRSMVDKLLDYPSCLSLLQDSSLWLTEHT